MPHARVLSVRTEKRILQRGADRVWNLICDERNTRTMGSKLHSRRVAPAAQALRNVVSRLEPSEM